MKFTSFFITAIILAGMIGFIVMPKSNFSENENRNLQKFPKFTFENIAEGKFTTDLSSYLSDHFPLRDGFIKLKTEFEKNILQKKLINNIYICSDNYYIEKYNEPENTDNIINTFNKFSKKTNVKPYLMLVPTAVAIYNDKLPEYAENTMQIDTLNKIYSSVDMNCIDVFKILKENKYNEQLYYRLDHHWTTDGAYLGYKAFCDAKGLDPLDKSAFKITTVTKDFKGTIYSKLNVSDVSDSIKQYYKPSDLSVIYDGKEYNSLYAPKYLKEKDKYSYFLNNLNTIIEITNNNIENNNTLVIAKDSYANCLVPFLANHYKKIYVFDPRSCKQSISEFANNHNATDILVLYNMNTIDQDTGVKVIY